MTEQAFQPRGMEDFEKDSEWFYKNIDLLRKQSLIGKFVAIKDKKVIASDKEINVVVSTIEKQGENPSYVLIEFVYPEGTVVLL